MQIGKECLVLVYSNERLSQYLAGLEEITVETDHKPLQTILSAPCRLQRMLLRLQCYNLVVKYNQGAQMVMSSERREQVPVQVRDYWNYRDEISLHNGLLFKSQRVIIPIALRSGMLSKVNSISCLRKAKDLVFWHGMRAEIKAFV